MNSNENFSQQSASQKSDFSPQQTSFNAQESGFTAQDTVLSSQQYGNNSQKLDFDVQQPNFIPQQQPDFIPKQPNYYPQPQQPQDISLSPQPHSAVYVPKSLSEPRKPKPEPTAQISGFIIAFVCLIYSLSVIYNGVDVCLTLFSLKTTFKAVLPALVFIKYLLEVLAFLFFSYNLVKVMVYKEYAKRSTDPSNFRAFSWASIFILFNVFLVIMLEGSVGLYELFCAFIHIFFNFVPIIVYSAAYNSSDYSFVRPWHVVID